MSQMYVLVNKDDGRLHSSCGAVLIFQSRTAVDYELDKMMTSEASDNWEAYYASIEVGRVVADEEN